MRIYGEYESGFRTCNFGMNKWKMDFFQKQKKTKKEKKNNHKKQKKKKKRREQSQFTIGLTHLDVDWETVDEWQSETLRDD